MKILMLGWELPPYNSGGLGVACYYLANALSREGVDIDFILPAAAKFDDSTFMNVLQPHLADESTNTVMAADPYSSDFDSVQAQQILYENFVSDHVGSVTPSVIHANDWLTLGAGVKAKQITGAPLVAHVHATEFDRSGGDSGNPLIHEIEEYGLMMADHIVAVSYATKQIIVEKYHIPPHKVEVIHNSSNLLDTHVTALEEYRYIESLKNEGYIVVAALGRLTRQKGLNYFLKAAEKALHRYERMVFVISGDGEQRNELIEMCADLRISDSVIFTGFVQGKMWRDVFTLADVFVMSSVSEPFGLTALEAAQHHTAITLTRQSGVGEVLKNSLRYDYWDIDRLADQLVNLALSPGLRNELSKNAFGEMSSHSWENVANRFLLRYRHLEGVPA